MAVALGRRALRRRVCVRVGNFGVVGLRLVDEREVAVGAVAADARAHHERLVSRR